VSSHFIPILVAKSKFYVYGGLNIPFESFDEMSFFKFNEIFCRFLVSIVQMDYEIELISLHYRAMTVVVLFSTFLDDDLTP
jgi:hypothetical protein